MKKLCIYLFLFTLMFSCREDEAPAPALQEEEDKKEEINPNQNIVTDGMAHEETDIAPLSSLVTFSTSEPVYVKAKVIGKNGSDSDIEHTFDSVGTNHALVVLGLYPDDENTVAFDLYNANDQLIDQDTLHIQTKSELPANLPEIEIIAANKPEMADGLTLISNYGTGMHVPFMIDHYGDIRWYLDYAHDEELSDLFYDNGMERLANGNLYFGNKKNRTLYEINMRGEKINTWDLGEYIFHHNIQEKPDGNFLVTVSKDGSTHENGKRTVEDYIIELDRTSGEVVYEWDLKESLDQWRTTQTDADELDQEAVDWFHANAVFYDERDHTILVSGRTQGLVKLNYNNQVEWILGPHKEWGTAGNGEDLNQFLLTPLDGLGNAITDEEVLLGNVPHADFEWNWYQHSPKIMPDGNLLLFDNGDNRNWGQAETDYSRAVVYSIDEENMTVQQVWDYGKERGTETFSFIVSDVDYLPDANHVIFSPGCIIKNTASGRHEGRVVEVDYLTGEVVFEARFIAPEDAFVVLHRSERLSLYPE